jgi:uncharacterized protein
MSATPEFALSLQALRDFDDQPQAMLEAFFERNRESVGLGFGETAGFLFAVVSCPEMILPSQWLEPVLGDVSFRDQAEAEQVLSGLHALHAWIGRRLDARELPLPPGFEPAAEPQANFRPGSPFGQWVRGFSAGHGWLREIWDRHVPDDAEEGAGLALMVLTFFASRQVAEGYHQDMYPEMAFEKLVEISHGMLPEAFFGYSDIGRSACMDNLQTPRLSEKIGRNAPCPCGSGKKHKKCCGRPH